MNLTIRGLLRRTFLFRIVHRYRERVAFERLTPADTKRAEFYSQFVNRGDLVFDVGTNMGNRTKAFLALGAEVVGFEPQPKCADYLTRVLRGNSSFHLVRAALGASGGEAMMHLSEESAISSLSADWIAATSKSGRFGDLTWNDSARVRVTTMDDAISEFGIPRFAKIDVEGFEFEVVSGLTIPIPSLSLEFTPEFLANTIQSLDHLKSLGLLKGQISLGESLEFLLGGWVDVAALKEALRRIEGSFGDVYIRLEEGAS